VRYIQRRAADHDGRIVTVGQLVLFKKKVLVPIMAVAFGLGVACAQPAEFLRAKDKRIVDGEGHEVLLRGMGLGGWMLQEGYMLGIRKEGTQHSIKSRIADLVGKEDCAKFYKTLARDHMTRTDVELLAKSGFNSIRLPMHYNLFTCRLTKNRSKGRDHG